MSFLVWTDLNEDECINLTSTTNKSKQRELLIKYMSLNKSKNMNPHKVNIYIEIYMNILSFAIKNKYSSAKISTLISLIKKVHEYCSVNPNLSINMQNAYKYFEYELLKHCVDRPPFSIAIFSHIDIANIADYFIEYYFKNLNMYQYVFNVKHDLKLNINGALQEHNKENPDYDDDADIDDDKDIENNHSNDEEEEEVEEEVALSIENNKNQEQDHKEEELNDEESLNQQLTNEEIKEFDQKLSEKLQQLKIEFEQKLNESTAEIIKQQNKF